MKIRRLSRVHAMRLKDAGKPALKSTRESERLHMMASRVIRLLKKNVCSVIAFGSITRPQDFVRGLSDVDLLVVVKKRIGFDRQFKLSSELGPDVELGFITPNQLEERFKVGDPLAFLLVKDGIVLHDDGTFARLSRVSLKSSELTEKALLRSTLAALSLSIEQWYAEAYDRSVNHAYHAMRHAIRLSALRKKGTFPVFDQEVLDFLPKEMKGLYTYVVNLRKEFKRASKSKAKKALGKAIYIVKHLLGLNVPTLSEVQRLLLKRFKGATVEYVKLEVKGKRIVWNLLVAHEEGVSRLTV